MAYKIDTDRLDRKRELVIIIKEGTDTAMFGRPGVQSTVGIKYYTNDCPYGYEDGEFMCFPNADVLTDEQIVEAVRKMLPMVLQKAGVNNHKYNLIRYE